MLDRVRSLNRLLVLNDEAHHVHDDDLEWNQTLLEPPPDLPDGLAAWLDFSATPRFQGGAHFPWIVCDYPLAQAVEDRIVKAPMILHLVDKAGARQGHWGERHREVRRLDRRRRQPAAESTTKAFKDIPDTKPVMFIMCETIQHADRIGEWLTDKSSPFKLKDGRSPGHPHRQRRRDPERRPRRAAPQSPRDRRPGEPGRRSS